MSLGSWDGAGPEETANFASWPGLICYHQLTLCFPILLGAVLPNVFSSSL
jgi:hypothetical protein